MPEQNEPTVATIVELLEGIKTALIKLEARMLQAENRPPVLAPVLAQQVHGLCESTPCKSCVAAVESIAIKSSVQHQQEIASLQIEMLMKAPEYAEARTAIRAKLLGDLQKRLSPLLVQAITFELDANQAATA